MTKRVLVVQSSPRRDGNSALLAAAAAEGARGGGHDVTVAHLDDHVREPLRDCRRCRDADGRCAIGDGYADLLLDGYLPADGIVFATPLYWYGVSGQLKIFLDRMFCYIARSYPDADRVVDGISAKTLGLLVASEETYPGGSLAVVAEMQEFARYTRSTLVGSVRGIGNRRGDVRRDPADPLGGARRLGRELFEVPYTDYRIDTDRPASTWP
jgi:multimeric flavodoxin WrbA